MFNNIHLEKDSFGIGESVSSVSGLGVKIVETVSSGIGTLYEPTRIKRLADAESYKIKTLSNAKKEAEETNDSQLAIRIGRLEQRVLAQELSRQNNIDIIVEEAIKQINQKESVSEEPVDKYWATRFINIAQDVSDDDMRLLWAKILADEVAKPSTYSLRTLETLRNLSKKEAETFIRLSQLVFCQKNECYVYRDYSILNKYGIIYHDILDMMDAGLVNAHNGLELKYEKFNTYRLIYYNYLLKFHKKQSEFGLPIIKLTKAGEQLYKIVDKHSKFDYLRDIAAKMKESGICSKYILIDPQNIPLDVMDDAMYEFGNNKVFIDEPEQYLPISWQKDLIKHMK